MAIWLPLTDCQKLFYVTEVMILLIILVLHDPNTMQPMVPIQVKKESIRTPVFDTRLRH